MVILKEGFQGCVDVDGIVVIQPSGYGQMFNGPIVAKPHQKGWQAAAPYNRLLRDDNDDGLVRTIGTEAIAVIRRQSIN